MKKFYLVLICFTYITSFNSQIIYNWQNSTEGWVIGGDCNLTAQTDAMAMRLFSSNALMRSGNLSANLGVNGSDYNSVEITVKNPTSGSGVARLFIYPPGTNSDTCYYTFPVDTAMSGFSTYTISLDSMPSGGLSSPYDGPIGRFGLRAPWGGMNFDTIFWKKMVISNTNQVIDSSEVTFRVDMNQVTDSFTNPEVNSTFNSWCGNCNAMSDSDGDNIWDVTVSLPTGDTIEYKFSADSWSIQETNDPTGSCTNGDPNYTNRVLVIPSNDTILTDVCWGSCDSCSSVIGIENDELNSFRIYPNPSSNFLNISSNVEISNFIIFNLFGKVILQDSVNTALFKINVSTFSNGPYFIYLKDLKSSTFKKFIINN